MRHKPKLGFYVLVIMFWVTGPANLIISQTPLITVQFANPQFNCMTETYCLDVEFRADTLGQELFGMNVRLFYDASILELTSFTNFQGNYGITLPPEIMTSPFGPELFNFEGDADFINAGIQKISINEPAILLDTAQWSRIFSMCFLVDSSMVMDPDSFCPPVVWDLRDDPSMGGFLIGDDGVVITVVDPAPENESKPAFEEVVQYNWEYFVSDTAPYGQPVQDTCLNIGCSLPVTWLAFSGSNNHSENILQWSTSEEWNNLGFEIERTFGGPDWEKIGFVKSAEAKAPTHNYRFVDYNPPKGNSFYRLRQIDSDGRFNYSSIINIVFNGEMDDFRIYPNPVLEGTVSLSLNELQDEEVNITFINATGQTVLKRISKELRSDINVSDLPSGLYIVYVLKGNEVWSERLIINNR
jgi:hypothetical protein